MALILLWQTLPHDYITMRSSWRTGPQAYQLKAICSPRASSPRKITCTFSPMRKVTASNVSRRRTKAMFRTSSTDLLKPGSTAFNTTSKRNPLDFTGSLSTCITCSDKTGFHQLYKLQSIALTNFWSLTVYKQTKLQEGLRKRLSNSVLICLWSQNRTGLPYLGLIVDMLAWTICRKQLYLYCQSM